MFQVKWKVYCLCIHSYNVKSNTYITIRAKYKVGLLNFQKYTVSSNRGLSIR